MSGEREHGSAGSSGTSVRLLPRRSFIFWCHTILWSTNTSPVYDRVGAHVLAGEDLVSDIGRVDRVGIRLSGQYHRKCRCVLQRPVAVYRVFVGGDTEKTANAGRRLPYHAWLVKDPTVDGDRDDLPRNELAALLQGRFGGVFQSAAAGDLHAHNGHALDIVRRMISVNFSA